ncbi:MAG: DNA (cytosine-5-)-methyltransferase [Flavobacteriales bacterium]|nr:DNA (cytosine-5-)-methyltransferase [Flavobacteriales bacterium]
MPALRVAELFAGVGGFRLGLEQAGGYQVVYSNQWEPGRRKQHASAIYVQRFGADHHDNRDIASVPVEEVPDHDVLVGGFPCQDYSVASTLRNARGLVGRKGVLWWQIHRLLRDHPHPPAHLVLENVDRLLSSPAGQRGRDLAVMLSSLWGLGYAVEWRVINAADYGMPQRRRRMFLVGHRIERMSGMTAELLQDHGVLAGAFPFAVKRQGPSIQLEADLRKLSDRFNRDGRRSPFGNAGVMVNGLVLTRDVSPVHTGPATTLGDILQPEKDVPAAFRIPRGELKRWRYLKGAKREARKVSRNGFAYHYSEGAMAFPDPLDKPGRTVVTGEGGKAPSRFKHVVSVDGKRFRRLTPIELERLNMFPDDHTAGSPDTWRAFFMGNALVVGIVERIGRALTVFHDHGER